MSEQSSKNWSCIEQAFQNALELGAPERDSFLAHLREEAPEMCDELQKLLAAHERAEEFLETPAVVKSDVSSPVSQVPLQVGARIGAYVIERLIAFGGMGTVYEAHQQNPERRVALKVMNQRLGSRSAERRFEFEVRVLGRLKHPGIAQIIEAGVAKSDDRSLPFFAMELVDGRKLTEYARAKAMSIPARLDLLIGIFEAVHHAHQRGIIHRDLKPDNILIDQSGLPKILDFGIARATDVDIQSTTMQTNVGEVLGTLAYMSPEQVAGDPAAIDIRSDVYALGVISYELITGSLPYVLTNKSLPEALRIIREVEPAASPLTGKSIRGDLRTIIAKALEKDKERRYPSASEFAADIRRFLDDEPIIARAPSSMYLLGKFARRHKPVVVGVAATLGALLLGLVLATRATIRARVAEREARELAQSETIHRETAEAERARAQRAAAISESVTDFLQEVLAGSDPEGTLGPDATIREALDHAARRVSEASSEPPEVQAAVNAAVGTTYHNLGLYEQAETHFRQTLATYQRIYGDEHPETLEAMNNLGYLLCDRGKLRESETLLRAAVAGFEQALGPNHEQRQTALNNLSVTLTDLGDIEGAASISREVLDARLATLGEDHSLTLLSLNNLGVVYMRLGRLEEAEAMIRRALSGRRRVLGEKHPRTIITLDNLALILEDRGKLDEAEAIYRESMALFRQIRGEEHPDTLIAMYSLAGLLHQRGQLDESEDLFRRTLEIRRRVLGDAHADTLFTMRHLAGVLADQERAAEAEAIFAEAVAIIQRTAPPSPAFVYRIPLFYASFLVERERFREAEPLMLYGYNELSRRLASDHRHVRLARESLVRLYKAWDKPDKAMEYSHADPGVPVDATDATP